MIVIYSLVVFLIFCTEKGLLILQNNKLRNIAIIAHVDHGKTTLPAQAGAPNGAYKHFAKQNLGARANSLRPRKLK